ncbi:MAG: DNA polymerase Y family protein [Acidobacteriaceae bacterium]
MTQRRELYACLAVREFPAQALLRLYPERHASPCVVMEGEPPLEQVCSLNRRARQLGLRHGMTRVEVELFPSAAVLARSHQAEAAARSMLLACAGIFSPRTELRDEGTALMLCIDIAGTEKLFGPSTALARQLLDQVQALGMAASITISRNLQAAVCMARSAIQHNQIRNALQRNRVHLLEPGKEAEALAPLPLSALALTPDQADTFALWGIRTLGMLAALPESALIARIGNDGKRLRQLARGEATHLFQPEEPVFTLEEQMQLDTPVDMLESLLFVLGMMLDPLILRARTQIVALASVTITLTLDNGPLHSLTVKPALPSNEKALWLKLLQLELEAQPPQAAMVAVALHAEPGATSKEQLGLFSPQTPEASRLDITLARLRALVGEGNAGRAVLEDTHAPEAFHIEPFTTTCVKPVDNILSQTRLVQRMLRPPEAVSVTLHQSTPAVFWFRAARYVVEQAYGPWKCNGHWWTQTLWGQEQWDLVARRQNGLMLCCCMVHDLTDNQWRMAALYD